MSVTTSPFGPLAVLIDPRTGDRRVADEVERALAAGGFEYRLQVADTSEELSRLSGAALEEGYRFVTAVGDDATVQDVVNGLFRDGRPLVEAPVLGVIAANTGCDLSLSFGLPRDVAGAVAHLAGDHTYPFDVMKIAVTGADGQRVIRYAHNIAAVGFHAAATIAAGRAGRGGNLRRFLGFWRAYASTRVQTLTIGTDRKTVQTRAWSVVIGNGQFADGGIRLSPRSFPGDGVLDALVFTGPKSDAYRLLPRIFRHGDHVPDPHITELRAKLKIDVTAPRPQPVVADGVALGTTPVTFQIVPQQILLKV
ncbi:MAG: diacylglycerol kinase family protein [Actinomycetota bacterium]